MFKNGKITRVLTDYFTFNRIEQRGILVLLIILLGVIIANAVIPSETFHKPVDFSAFEKEVTLFEEAWIKAEREDSLQNRGVRSTISPSFIVELNSADTFDLQRLRGIGPAFARRIIQYRSRLGGFYEKEQILEVFGMDTSRFMQIKLNLIVNKDSIKTIDLNNITFKALLRHPYFPFELTKNIMLYRQKNKRFNSLEELSKIPGINDSLVSRIKVYLRLDP